MRTAEPLNRTEIHNIINFLAYVKGSSIGKIIETAKIITVILNLIIHSQLYTTPSVQS